MSDIARLQRVLLGLVLLLTALDAAWWLLAGFHLDAPAYSRLAALSLGLLGAGLYYQERRGEPQIAAMLLGTAFLIQFSAAASVLNYMLIPVAGPQIDGLLVAADAALGFDWYRVMLAMADRPLLNLAFFNVYNLVLPEIALVLVALAWSGRAEQAYRFCLTLAAGALIAIFFWASFPSLGAKSLYSFAPDIAARLTLTVTTQYGQELVALLKNGPGFISPADMRGLIAFPSYHGVLALIVTWYGWNLRGLRWPLVALNAVILVSTPVQGGHHMVDVLAAFPVTALALVLAGEWNRVRNRAQMPGLVNRMRNLTIQLRKNGLFRAMPAQQARESRAAD
ncbi:MAG TPA: phosphatase PAP2 family protein [Rhizomicrobium sp.]|nr:phosphatase PAP2 family protein [Rhizomicrobium sp.]